MSKNLTHLNALYALEASARLGNFTRAAEELGVTPAAVGQQVRILESYLGRKLFHRTPGGLQPTVAASSALVELHDGFDKLEIAFKRLSGPTTDNHLSVSVAPALAGKWLAPRMQGLYQRCPQIDLRIDTSLRLADIAAGEFDVSIRYGTEVQDGLRSSHLLQEYILPICAPSLRDVAKGSLQGEEMLHLPLLHIDGETNDPSVPSWADWGKRHGLCGDKLLSGPRYPHSMMAVEAALNSQGVTLCGLTLVIDDLLEGRLIAPLGADSVVKTRSTYRIIHSPTRHQSEIQTTFIRWIKAEASKTRESIARFLASESEFAPPVEK